MSNVTQVSEHVFEIGGMGDAPRQTVTAAPQVVVATLPTASAARLAAPATGTPAGPPTARQLLAQLRARLAVVKREIRAREKLELERDQLQRLIRAANTELDNVRRLRAG